MGGDASNWLSTVGRLEPADPVALDTERPQSARMYDYYLGGKTNFAIDRATADKALAAAPQIREFALANRAFMARAVRFLAAECGVDQFLDIGTGIPTSPNVHEIAQRARPAARIVYVDHDPVVLAHARALMANGTPEGRVDYVQADVREPEGILGHPCLAGADPALDLGRPVALQILAVAHFLPDERDPYGLVRRYVDALPSGSYLALSHATVPDPAAPAARAATASYRATGVEFQLRTAERVARFADGLEVLDPGVAQLSDWRPDPDRGAEHPLGLGHGFVARKP